MKRKEQKKKKKTRIRLANQAKWAFESGIN